MITAVGGPVSYSISLPAGEQSYLSLSQLAGKLQAGETQAIVATVVANPNGPPPAFYNTVTLDPGGVIVVVEYPPSG